MSNFQYKHTVSSVYKNGGVVKTSSINEENVKKGAILDDMVQRGHINREVGHRLQQVAAENRHRGIQEGADYAYRDITNRLASAQQQPIVEGSPEDIQMQQNRDRGFNHSNTGLLDEVSRLAAQKQTGQEQPSQYNQQGIEARDSLLQDARDTAFSRAHQIGDTSEGTINKLMIEELHKRGLE